MHQCLTRKVCQDEVEILYVDSEDRREDVERHPHAIVMERVSVGAFPFLNNSVNGAAMLA